MRAATEGSLPPVMPQGNLVAVLGRDVRQGSPGELMVVSSSSRQRRPPCKTNREMSDEAAAAAALTYLLTYSRNALPHCFGAVDSAASAMHCRTALGQWAVELLQCTARLPGGSGQCNSAHPFKHYGFTLMVRKKNSLTGAAAVFFPHNAPTFAIAIPSPFRGSGDAEFLGTSFLFALHQASLPSQAHLHPFR